MPLNSEKQQLRETYKRLRSAYTPLQREQMHRHLSEAVFALPAFCSPSAALLCYASLPDEVDTWRILQRAWQTGKTVAMPRCAKDGNMAFYRVTGMHELQSGMLGISEPAASCAPYVPSADDLCIVPALAFDRSGHRLGYGGGYYDRYLSRFPMITVGLCYPNCLAEQLPAEPFDIPVRQVLCRTDEKEAQCMDERTPNQFKSEFGSDVRADGNNSTSDRSEKVRNFQVHIDEDAGVGDFSYTKDRPVYKGEVYFSNHARGTNASPVQSTRPNAGPGRVYRQPSQQAARPAAQKAQPQTQSTATKKKKKKKKKKHGYLSSAAKLLISVAICTGLLSAVGITTMNDILAINRSAEPVAVELPENADTNTVIDVLHEADLISNPILCKAFYRLESEIRHTKEPKYIAGMISLKASMGLEGMLNRVKENQQLTETVKLYFPEGWTAKQIFEKLAKYDVCEADFLFKAVEDINFNYTFLSSAKGANSSRRYLLLEGYLFPDTYEFFVDYNANSVIERFLTRFDEIWTAEYQARAEELNMTVDEVVRLASIIQREAANKQQMSQISSVLHNRLNHSVNYPTLDCDSTYNYIDTYVTPVVGDVMGEQYRKYYNTYVCEKLPAGAICNPGADAIHAALYPDDTDYYYFQHDNKGNIYLARTNAEHNRYRSEIAWKNAG